MPPIFSEIPPYNGVALLLVWTVVVGSGGVDVSFWAGEDFEMLFLLFFISAKIWLSVSVICFDVLSSLFVVLISLLIVGLNDGFNGKELVIELGIHIVTPFWNFETWGRKSGDIRRRWALMYK